MRSFSDGEASVRRGQPRSSRRAASRRRAARGKGGYLSLEQPSDGVSPPFRDALRQLGYTEGQNLLIEARFADATVERLSSLAAELIQREVDVIGTIGTPPVKAAKDATATIPIVMAGSADPVQHGLVASLARPGGNVTGVTHSPGPQFAAKGLELLKEASPKVSRVGILWDSSGIHEGLSLQQQQLAAPALGIALLPIDVKTLPELTAALSEMKREHVNGLFVFPNFISGKHAQLILDFAATNRLPTMPASLRALLGLLGPAKSRTQRI